MVEIHYNQIPDPIKWGIQLHQNGCASFINSPTPVEIWLDKENIESDWLFDVDGLHITFEDEDTAIMFKLIWG